MSQVARFRAVTRVYLISLATNLVMLTLKLTVGFITGSLVMIADGVDSSLDAIANVIAMAVTRIAGNPPDKDHPYGHRRFETLAAMMVGGFLLLTASEIVKSSVQRLLSGAAPEIGVANFAVMLLAVGVNLALFSLQRREGKRLRSEVLIASSEDKRSDIMVSVTVLLSLVTVELGLSWIDAAAALMVVVVMGRNALRIVMRAAGVLVDRAALDAEAVRQVVAEVPGVYHVTRVRSRGSEDDVHLDLAVNVAPPMTVDHSAALAEEIRDRLRDRFDGLSDIEVNFEPAHDTPPDYALIARAEGAALGLGVHEVVAAQVEGALMLDMHVEVLAQQTVEEAHEAVSRFEARLMEAIPALQYVVTHIEPAYGVKTCFSHDVRTESLARQALRVATQLFPDNHWHNVRIRTEPDGGYALSMHCRVAGSTSVDEAHRLAELVETRVRTEMPAVHRVTIHIEPFDRRTPQAADQPADEGRIAHSG